MTVYVIYADRTWYAQTKSIDTAHRVCAEIRKQGQTPRVDPVRIPE